MIELYIETRGERTFLGTYSTRAEVGQAKNKWLKENGFGDYSNKSRFCRSWITSDGEQYEDFGSWTNFFVEVYS